MEIFLQTLTPEIWRYTQQMQLYHHMPLNSRMTIRLLNLEKDLIDGDLVFSLEHFSRATTDCPDFYASSYYWGTQSQAVGYISIEDAPLFRKTYGMYCNRSTGPQVTWSIISGRIG